MKKFISSSGTLLILAFFSSILLTRCSDDDDPTPTPPDETISAKIAADPNLSILEAALVRAGLNDDLAGTGPYTLFAPDNAAFTSAGITETSISTMDSATLAGILLYHSVSGNISAANVPASDTVRSLEGKNLFASKNANGTYVNGATVTTGDMTASNGVIHIINAVLMPPTQTIAEIAAANPQFSIFLSAAEKAGLTDTLDGPGKWTVFAPADTAFVSAGLDQATIDAGTPEMVRTIVSDHLLTSNLFSSDLITDATASTITSPATVTLRNSPAGVKLTGSANDYSDIITTTPGTTYNVVATNGVIHIVGKVIR